ncbi:small-conductance mechanosensitive channel [Mesorhizobium sp. YL-MeA3-2017]|uniref:hypothetical protein n=1 Tax=Mesorhizobium sp. YL-MeA3-2017 TaxID=3042284 RepID=UPI0015CBEBE5|nr:hypothetical protein [Mesorhizobium sp. YL-MeA3-2017]MDQ0333044.1 small-conductance mechanosensitive channel [Mesorhizobium sp. YL-MeA3-2017]
MADGKDVSINEIYKEQYAHFRAMNDILYKIPPLFSAAIGGLWYFAASQLTSDRLIAVGIFVFAAVVSVCSVLIMGRFSLAFSRYITKPQQARRRLCGFAQRPDVAALDR